MTNILRTIWAGLVGEWCSYIHGGGKIERDPYGHINWQCAKCGRWAEPVTHADEQKLLSKNTQNYVDTL